ncbi:MAG: efflux RND transporter permease subunit [Candidatus Aminicenantes bacterium]|nr:efflux RND transporter permease subunit [Candidatus Aminicenantes bacterium]
MSISDISIKRPIMMSMLLLVFLVFGALAYFTLSLDMMPEVEIGFVTIRTIYPGTGPREMETQVSKKIEDAVATISKIDWMRSYSMDSVSLVLLAFEIGKDPDVAVREAKDKIDAILNDLPDDAQTPIVEKFDIRAESVLDILLTGKQNLTELYELADKRLKDRFSQVEGVAQVNLVGGQEREIRIELDNRVVFENAISLAQLSQVLKIQNLDMPGGQFQQKSQEYAVRLKGQLDNLETIKKMEVPTAFGTKKLSDIANIRDASKEVRERTIYFDNLNKLRKDNVVLLSIIKSPEGNTVNMVRDIRERVPEIEKDLPAGCQLSIVNDNSVFIESSVDDTMGNIYLGILLTGLVLLFFLHDLRSTIIVAVAMPFSIISTFMLLQISGFSLNIMSLMGLSTSVGILVANSVVILENIFRHRELGLDRKNSAMKGTSEIAVAVLASTLTNIVVFLPIASMSSLIGQFFKQFALTVTYATVFSLLISFTLTPMMASMILPERDTKKHPLGQKLENMFHGWEVRYQKLLRVLLANKVRSLLVVAGAVGLLFLSFISAARVGFEFMPQLDEGAIGLDIELPQGYNLEETAKFVNTIEDRIQKHPEVKHMLTKLGFLNELDTGANLARIVVKLVDIDKRDISNKDAANRFIKELADIPNARINVAAISMEHGGGSSAPIQFYLMGQDVDRLENIKNRMAAKIKGTPGLVNLTTSSRAGKPEIILLPDRKKLADVGLTVYDLAMALRGAVEGIEATRYKEAGEEYDIRIVMNKDSVDTPEKVGNIAVVSPKGVFRLSQLAQVNFSEGFSKILHNDKYKAIEFTANTAPGFVLGDVVKVVREKMSQIELPAGYKVQWGGDVEMMEEAIKDMLRTFLIAVLLTYMLLAAMLESLTQPLMIMGTVPMALMGVFVAMDLTGSTMNIISMLAIVMLVGIVVNNAILILDYTNILRREGRGVKEALIEACPTKLKPIIMSTVAIILGMIPMALGMGASGREFRQPMGIVSIGGLVASTLLTLVVMPALYYLTTRQKKIAEN